MSNSFNVIDALGTECFDAFSNDNLPDIACSIYLHISGIIGDESQFVGSYLDGIDSATDNPNLATYDEFETSAYEILDSEKQPLYPSIEAISLLKSELEMKRLESFQDGSDDTQKCACGLLFQLVKAIDRVFSDTKKDILVFKKRGPLNERNKDKVGLYLKSPNNFIEDFFGSLYDYSSISRNCLNEQLTSFVFFLKEEGFALPHIFPATSSFDSQDAMSDIKIAIAPFRGDPIPFAKESSETDSLFFEYDAGSLFSCKYAEDYGLDCSEQLWAIIDKAVKAGCIMLALPGLVAKAFTVKPTQIYRFALRRR